MKLLKYLPRLKKLRRTVIVREVVGLSMYPSLREGSLLIASSLRVPQPGMVIIFKHDGKEKVKRLHSVEQGRYFVLGDNIGQSTDSRHFGWINAEAVLGTVLWPRASK